MEILRHPSPHTLFRRVAEVVRREGLLRPDDRVLVGVSGGPDSVCLLALLSELRESGRLPGLRLHIAHVNYGLRGAESDGDEAFVRELGARLGVGVSVERARLTPKSGGSLQSRAREIRYAFFARLLREQELAAVATGHTADDQAETVLLWLIRGAGTGGLAGIPVLREGRIIRPLLGVTRRDVLDYLACRGFSYRSDATNVGTMYRRNRIRHEVLPLLRSFNPRIVEGLAREAEILAADAAVLEDLDRDRWRDVVVEAVPGRVVLDRARLAAQPLGLRRRLVRQALALMRGNVRGLTFRHVDDILGALLEGSEGAGLNLPGGVRVARAGEGLRFGVGEAEHEGGADQVWASGLPLPIPGEVRVGASGRLIGAVEGRLEGREGPEGRSQVVVDGDQLRGPLVVRAWRPGDWFCPAGMGGKRKKLQDFFVDQKVRRDERGRVPLVVAPAGIVWVVGYRGDERFRAGATAARPIALSWKVGGGGAHSAGPPPALDEV
jgi:tRNA(Ile)-lysidine synthase